MNVNWRMPTDLAPGSEVLVHLLWVPRPEYRGIYAFPPDPPNDVVAGYYSPSPKQFEFGFKDPSYSACSSFTRGFVSLFQEDPDTVSIEVLDSVYKIPCDLPGILADVFEGFKEKSEPDCSCSDEVCPTCGHSFE